MGLSGDFVESGVFNGGFMHGNSDLMVFNGKQW